MNKQQAKYFIINPDYPEQGKARIWVSENDLDTFYYGMKVKILAVKIDSEVLFD